MYQTARCRCQERHVNIHLFFKSHIVWEVLVKVGADAVSGHVEELILAKSRPELEQNSAQ